MQGLGCQLKYQSADRQHSLKLETVSSNVFSFFHNIFQIPQIDADKEEVDLYIVQRAFMC